MNYKRYYNTSYTISFFVFAVQTSSRRKKSLIRRVTIAPGIVSGVRYRSRRPPLQQLPERTPASVMVFGVAFFRLGRLFKLGTSTSKDSFRCWVSREAYDRS